jgi:hypothetical protein
VTATLADLIAYGTAATLALLGITSIIYAALLWLDSKFTVTPRED